MVRHPTKTSMHRLLERFYGDRATKSETTRRACHRQYRRDSSPRSVALSLQSVSFSVATRRFRQPLKRKRKLLPVRPVSTRPGTATIACQRRSAWLSSTKRYPLAGSPSIPRIQPAVPASVLSTSKGVIVWTSTRSGESRLSKRLFVEFSKKNKFISFRFSRRQVRRGGTLLPGRRVDLPEHVVHSSREALRRAHELLRPLGRVQLRYELRVYGISPVSRDSFSLLSLLSALPACAASVCQFVAIRSNPTRKPVTRSIIRLHVDSSRPRAFVLVAAQGSCSNPHLSVHNRKFKRIGVFCESCRNSGVKYHSLCILQVSRGW